MTPFNCFTILLTLCIFSTACNKKTTGSTEKSPNQGNTEKITATSPVGSWAVINFPYTAEKDKTQETPKQYIVNFLADNSMSLSLDVNNCGTSYKVKDGYLVFEEGMSCTEACCDSKAAVALSSMFYGSLKYSIDNAVMTITTEKGPIELINTKDGLLGTSWVAVNYSDLKDQAPKRFAKKYTLTFGDKRLNLNLDVNSCNTGIRYNHKMSSVELEANMGCTRKCCDDKEGLALMAMLKGKITYKKEGKQLILNTTSSKIALEPAQNKQLGKD